MNLIRVADDTTVPELEEGLRILVHRAKREMPKVGSDLFPTRWDIQHRRVDALLDAWMARHVCDEYEPELAGIQ